jgi:hypothetical protein
MNARNLVRVSCRDAKTRTFHSPDESLWEAFEPEIIEGRLYLSPDDMAKSHVNQVYLEFSRIDLAADPMKSFAFGLRVASWACHASVVKDGGCLQDKCVVLLEFLRGEH